LTKTSELFEEQELLVGEQNSAMTFYTSFGVTVTLNILLSTVLVQFVLVFVYRLLFSFFLVVRIIKSV